jgi:TrmH family RNA methyltransferase
MAVSKAQLKYIRSLQQKKYRQKYNNFVVEGDKIVEELIRVHPGRIEALYALTPWLERHREALPGLKERIAEVTPQELKQLSGLHTPNQVLALVRIEADEPDAGCLTRGWTLFLDGIRDPGNLGTILRIADWFGIPCVCCSPDCVDQYNPKVIQASMGAFLRVDCIVTNLDELRRVAGSLPILGADLNGENLFQAPLPARGIVVIGSEAHGLSPQVQEQLTHRISIPRGAGGGAESLNAAVAAGIICAVLQNRP